MIDFRWLVAFGDRGQLLEGGTRMYNAATWAELGERLAKADPVAFVRFQENLETWLAENSELPDGAA